MAILHEHDLVHGDVQSRNVLVTEKGGMLIDFDWSGPVGVARYPWTSESSSAVDWAPGRECGKKIEKEHDVFMLSSLEL